MVIKNSNIVIEKLSTFPGIAFLFVALFVKIAISYIFGLMSKFFRHKSIMHEMMVFSSKTEELFMVMLAGPLVETFLFQYLPFYFLKRKWADIYTILLAALLFGSAHFYNWIYFLNATCAGILYGFVYASKARVGKGFLYTALLHILYNFFAFISNHF
jgi:membrane protease YdiL (CAAX protease family)